jgi:hypothetical protein
VKELPMKFISNSNQRTVANFINQFRYFASIIFLVLSFLFLPGAGKLVGNSEVALAASDPVIAVQAILPVILPTQTSLAGTVIQQILVRAVRNIPLTFS